MSCFSEHQFVEVARSAVSKGLAGRLAKSLRGEVEDGEEADDESKQSVDRSPSLID